VLVDSVQIEGDGERAERTAYKQAEKVRTRLLADADELKVARTKATVGRSWSASWPSTRSTRPRA
jgi:hypothetical protein